MTAVVLTYAVFSSLLIITYCSVDMVELPQWLEALLVMSCLAAWVKWFTL